MEKTLSCRLFGYDCEFVVRDESEEALLQRYADHLKEMHRVAFTQEIREEAESLIRQAA